MSQQISDVSTNRTELTKGDLYKGAGDEIVGRMQVRNRILLSFATVSGGLIGVSAAQNGLAFVGIGVGFLALFSVLLSGHHELMIAHLMAYQKQLLGTCTLSFPTWYDFEPKEVSGTRHMRDWAQYGLYGSLGLAALAVAGGKQFFAMQNLSAPGTEPWPVFLGKGLLLLASFSSWILSLFFVHYYQKKREKILGVMRGMSCL